MASGNNSVLTHIPTKYKNEKGNILLTKVKSSPLEYIKIGFRTVSSHVIFGEQNIRETYKLLIYGLGISK